MGTWKLDPVREPGRMSSYWKKEWKIAGLIVLTGTLFNAGMSAGPILQGRILDLLLAGGKTAEILRPLGQFLLVIAAVQGLRFLKRYYVRVFANRTEATMRKMVYNHLIHRNLAALREEKTGDLMTKSISDVGACVEGMRKFTTEIFDTGVLMLSYFVTLLYHGVGLTLCACAFLPVAMVLAEKLKTLIFKYTRAYRAQLSAVSDLTYETVENALLYRLCSAEETNLRRYHQALEELEHKAVRANVLENSMQPIYNVIAMVGVIFIAYFGGKNVLAGTWSLGQFSAYLTIFSALAVKASKAAKLFNSVQKAQVSWKRLQPYLTEYQQDPPASRPQPRPISLKMDQMSFTYPGAERAVVEHISFEAESGQMVGVTGPVAGGKSTLALALLGLYPYGGSITLNGRELRSCPGDFISDAVAYMGHDSCLLSDTIARNITLGDDGDVLPVLRDVCFDRDLAAMPQGVETRVGSSGVRLSGGQQARLALARALYRGSSVLVLDDPFSAVDMTTERQILQNLKERYRDRLIVFVSHRVSQFALMDQVLLVEKGTAVWGSHPALLASSPTYREIFTMQKEVAQDAGNQH